MLMFKRVAPKGFTIVELLIVIVAIGILSTIIVVSYNGVQANSRDAARISTVNAIAKALGLYYLDNGKYPIISDGAGTEGSCGADTPQAWGWCDRMKTLSDALAPYMTLDPTSLSSATTGTTYYYYYNSAINDSYKHYGLMVYLEGSGGQNDGGYFSNAYEVGENPAYCMRKYTGSSASWKWSSPNTRCQGGN